MKLFRHGAALAVLLACGAASSARAAVTADNFLLRTTDDLVALCDAKQGDPQGVAAIHECEGFIVGVYQYHESVTAGGDPRAPRRIYCLPADGAPNRDTAAQMFVAWSRTHSQYMSERPIDGLTRFAVDTWPCPRAPARRAARPAAPRASATPAPAPTPGQPTPPAR
jgi:hypothetical protein